MSDRHRGSAHGGRAGTMAETDGDDTGIVCWVDGRLVPAGSPAIRPEDRGLVGYGAFEAIKVVDGVPFALERHLERLLASAAPLAIDIDLTAVREAIEAILSSAHGLRSPFWLRLTATAGPARMAGGERPTAPTLLATVAPMLPWEGTARVVVVPWCRNERGALVGLKTLSYLENGLALLHARERGADEGLFANTVGNLCEGAGSNVFVARGGRILTPPLSSGCLAGVTRALLLEWMPDIVEADVPVDDLLRCDEAFLTSTSRDVHPIVTVDGHRLPKAPGPLTRRAMSVFAEAAAAELHATRPLEAGGAR